MLKLPPIFNKIAISKRGERQSIKENRKLKNVGQLKQSICYSNKLYKNVRLKFWEETPADYSKEIENLKIGELIKNFLLFFYGI